MTTFISTCATKKEFADRVRAGGNMTLLDPNLTRKGPMYITLRDIQDSVGYSFIVTNKLRKWFAGVTVKEGRRLVVK